jgi:hypothetical protein
MKSLKMLALAAIAALGLMAFVGAGTASATTLCTTATGPCYPAGTSLHASLVPNSTARLTSPAGTTVVTCPESTLTADMVNNTGTWIEATIHTLDWSEKCTSKVESINASTGKLTIMWTEKNNAEVVADATQVTVVIGGVSCVYTAGEGTKLGTMTGGAEPILKIETKVKKSSGSFACPLEPTWDAEYVMTEPHAIFAIN